MAGSGHAQSCFDCLCQHQGEYNRAEREAQHENSLFPVMPDKCLYE